MSLKNFKKITSKIFYKSYFLGLTAFGITLIIFSCSFLGYRFYQKTILSFDSNLNTESFIADEKVPTQIVIPSASINTTIASSVVERGIWEVHENTASFPKGAAKPGEGGNIIIYGHNKRAILGNLKKVTVGDKIIISTGEKKDYFYEVTEISRVSPENIASVLPTDHEELTLYTCSGFMDSQRLVVKAKPLNI